MSNTYTLPVLYSFRRCPYAMRARMAIILSSVECELREILLKNKPEEMLSLSPKGTVPVLTFGNKVLDESMDVINWAFAKDSSKFLKYSSSESKLSNYFVGLFDAKFKYHLDRYKYASRYERTSDDHQGECLKILLELNESIAAGPWIFGATVSLLDISILPFIRQCKIANPHWFLEQDFKKVINLLDYFESSALFHSAMKKFDEWSPDNPQVVIFPSKSLS
ncbi:glutathione S-transferase N-terminal domain-containing protein [bacterium]|nr:glutathione S-transferase N-terminal domain-containing protein [bacterium]MDA9023645.1 glutathione S-transferase N-terminal domain-containing protein [Gammaproteobacteria bacterium]MDA9834850.1 glutathione S-transferase N-terminal domain-containing protein [Gammaproteobacteria bacterium]MDA9979063.1 glutathione S-transferase N-terminal domain-containing protein [Gammaproteobacteria bacterium]MDC3372186.1 glutathione S-transferase N-terminal domain-containing protein [Gammaproteobacteria bact